MVRPQGESQGVGNLFPLPLTQKRRLDLLEEMRGLCRVVCSHQAYLHGRSWQQMLATKNPLFQQDIFCRGWQGPGSSRTGTYAECYAGKP